MSEYKDNNNNEQQSASVRDRLAKLTRSPTLREDDSSATSTTSVRNSFLAGWTAGVTGTLAGHPLDSLKVWVQTGAGGSQKHSFTSTNLLGTIRRFYAGVGGPMVTVGAIQSINFAVYDSTRRYWYYHFDNPTADPSDGKYFNNDSYASIAIAGMTAGAVLSLITSPVMQIKTLQQTQADMNFRKALQHMLKHPTIGFGTHFAVETSNRAVYFCTYEFCKRHIFQTYKDDGTANPMSLTGRMLSAAAAGMSCWGVCYPLDVLRSRLYSSSGAGNHVGAREMISLMRQERGWKAFYRGFAITTIRAGPVAAAILPVYDLVLDKLNSMDV